MFCKAFREEFVRALRRLWPVYLTSALLILIARLVLTCSTAIAIGGKPPLLSTIACYAAYFASLLCCVTVFVAMTVRLKHALLPHDAMSSTRCAVSARLLCAMLFPVLAYALFFGGYFLLSAGDSYYAYFFSGLIPPLAYHTATYGTAFVLYTALSFSLVLAALPCVFAACFAFAARFRRHNIPAISAFLVFYALALVLFLWQILSDFPRTDWFTYYFISGNYASWISGYLALAVSFLPVGILAFFLTPFFLKKAVTAQENRHSQDEKAKKNSFSHK